MMILPKTLTCTFTLDQRSIAAWRDVKDHLQVKLTEESAQWDNKLKTILHMLPREYYALQLQRNEDTDLCWIITRDEKGTFATHYWGLNNDQADKKLHRLGEKKYWNSKWRYQAIFDGKVTADMHQQFRDHFFDFWDSFAKSHYWICHDFTIIRDDKGVTKVDFRSERPEPSQLIRYEAHAFHVHYGENLFGNQRWY